MSSEIISKPTRQTFVVADLKCYLCGTVTGSIEREQSLTGSKAASGPVVLHRPGQREAIRLTDWRGLRCQRCGGPLFLDETDVITRRSESYNWLDERPRRGRPPKRLVEERRREREEFESQAA
jgi:hypothetical protein